MPSWEKDSLPPAEAKKLDAAVAELRRQYRAGLARVKANTGGLFESSEEASVRRAYEGLGQLLEKWAGTYRRWAEGGRRDDGTAYSVARWLAFGQSDLGDAIQYVAKEAYDRSLLGGLEAAARATVETVTSPSLWPGWVKGAVAGGVLLVGLLAWTTAREAGRELGRAAGKAVGG